MRRALLALPLLLLLPLPAAAAAELGVARSFGDWIVGCDNTASCTAIGLAPDDASAFAYLRVSREGGPGTAPRVAVSILDELETGGAIRLELPGGALPVDTLDPDEAEPVSAIVSAAVGEDDTAAFLAALRPAPNLAVSIGSESVPVSLDGMSAALRFMDAAQERAGTANALVATGERPEDTVPPAPEASAIEAVALREIDTPAERPDGLATRSEYCPDGFGDLVFEAADGTRLWGVCTSVGAYNLFTDFSIVRDGVAIPADLGPQGTAIGTGEEESGSTLVNAGLNENGRTIDAFAKARGLGDCGSLTSWAFDGEAMVLVEEAFMGECRGVQPDDWPVLHRAEVSGG